MNIYIVHTSFLGRNRKHFLGVSMKSYIKHVVNASLGEPFLT